MPSAEKKDVEESEGMLCTREVVDSWTAESGHFAIE